MEDLAPIESDETLLSIYRNQLSSNLPFVVISASTTAIQLATSRPCLMKVIRMVASVRHLQLVRGQSRAVMVHISNAMLVKSERSLDLLQGILVFLGFHHYHCMAHAQFNNLVRLAISLVEDLGIGASPKSQPKSQMSLMSVEEPVSSTNEEKRALLGLWYMSSTAGLIVKQLAITRFTKDMDQCLHDLDDSREYKTDQLLIQLVRIQRLTEETFHFHNSDSPNDERHDSSKLGSMERLDTFRVKLEVLRHELSPALETENLLSCYYNSACLRIYEPLMAVFHLPDSDSQSFASLTLLGVSIPASFSHFTAALKAWLKTWLAIPVCSYFYMPQPAYIQLVHGAMMITRWIKVVGPEAVKVSIMEHVEIPEDLPALSGVPSCPDLSLQEDLASPSGQVSVRILNTLRARVISEPELQIEILKILDIMIARFQAAKVEIQAAQGVYWENDFWNLAAEHLTMKKARLENWREILKIAAGGERNPPADSLDSAYEGSRESISVFREQNIDIPGWAALDCDWGNVQWESAMFDVIFQDIHTAAGNEI